ncbi:glycosyltransferase [Microcystis aeruginosa BLCCF158]|uniref:Glycosyltransferase n=1 Tax=Microcystis aeruginosa BLCC-F158 TaxID=2755316 RepID=A0A841V1S5_MICAE|nr:glycosyltransferase [Microcystis aeruginosa]MBC1195000.1 glycosyltransferase [Microcystis aeruginosa BLCC-F158]
MIIRPEFLSWVVIAAGCFYSLYLCISVPKDVFFNGDGALKALLARQLSNGPWRFDLAERAEAWVTRLWQEGLYTYRPPFVYYLNQRYYISFPFPFSLLTSLFYKLWGYRGFYLIPLLSIWVLWLSFSRAIPAFFLDSWGGLLGLVILIFASPLTLYSAIYCEHTLAVTLGFLGIVIAFFLPDTANSGWLPNLLGGFLVGLSVWFRSECLALVATLTLLVFLGLTPEQTSIFAWYSTEQNLNFSEFLLTNRIAFVFVLGMIVSVFLLWLCNKLIYNRFLGVHALLVLEEFSWKKRIQEALTSFYQLNSSFLVHFPICIIPLAYLLTWSGQQLNFAKDIPVTLISVMAIIILAVLVNLRQQGMVKTKALVKDNIIYFLILLASCYLFDIANISLDKQMLFVYALYFIYTVGVSCLVDIAPGEVMVGGKQWGPRYLLPLIPFVTLLTVEQVKIIGANQEVFVVKGSWVLLLILLAIGVYKNIYQGGEFFYKTHQGIAPAIKSIEEDTNSIVAFSHQYAAQVLGFGLEKQKTFFRVEDSQAMVKLCQELVSQGLSSFPYVCYPYRPCQLLESPPEELEFSQDGQKFQIGINRSGIIGKYPFYEIVISATQTGLLAQKSEDKPTITPAANDLVCTILPTYNERDNISQLIERLLASVPSPYLVLVVDDNSPDETWQIVEDLAQQYPTPPQDSQFQSGVILCRRINEKGLTSALQRGIDDAINLYGAKIITWMDCDLSMPPEDVPQLITAIRAKKADMAVGSRWIPGGDDVAHGLMARMLSWIINRMAIVMLGNQVHDYTSGFIAVRSQVLEKIRLKGDYGEYCIDLLTRANRLGYKLVEVPYLCVPRIYGESKTGINLWDYLSKGRKYVATIWQLWQER